ncbi:MAG: pyridoxamine 5'-phosphate oxidase family protein [Lentisphaerae bacterium]|nr:pyridoxamine 5'-phosphate oxidase family protein [Lentisphaerota bacterium]
MSTLPESIRNAWNDRNGPVVVGTVDENGLPNLIYATCVGTFGDDRLVVADNYFNKTRHNAALGGQGSILFMDKAGKAYQLKGRLEYHTSGEVYDSMKRWNPEKHPGHAALALRVEAAFSGAQPIPLA